MATTCDYCHKPLSLMRRLRGEQFCSVEHLDLYTAQQAEFALQRLAASVEDTPASQRPPALLKRIARTPVEANGHSNGNGNGTLVKDTPPPELPSKEFLRIADAIAEPPIRLRRLDPPVEPPVVDYPMAGFIVKAPGNLKPGETPKFTVEPSVSETHSLKPRLNVEPRSAPPVAPLQALRFNEPQLDLAPSLIAADTEFASSTELPRLQPEPSVAAPPFAPLQVLSMDQASAETAAPDLAEPTESSLEHQFPRLDANLRATAWSHDQLFYLAVPPMEASRPVPELLARPADLPAEFTAPKVDVSRIRMEETLDGSDLLIQPPAAAPVIAAAARLLPGHLNLTGLSELEHVPSFAPEFAKPDAEPISVLPLASRIPYDLRPIAMEQSATLLFQAAEPEVAREFPSIPEWSLPQSFEAPAVVLPESQPKASPAAAPRGHEAWVPSISRLQTPRMPGASPHFAKSGPNFGWELARPKAGLAVSRLQPTGSAGRGTAEVVALPIAPQVRPAIADLGTTSEWSRPRAAAHVELAAESNLNTLSLAPRVREIRARVEARLEAIQLQESEGWATPRIDSTMLAPSVHANARPASSPLDLRIQSISDPAPVGLALVWNLIPQRPVIEGPAVPASQPSSWTYPSGDPQAALFLEPAASLRPGRLAPNSPRSSSQPATPIADLQPLRYRAVSLVVVPPPNYRLRPSELKEEVRYAALAPKGVYRLPRIRHTGFRMPGPYPKTPKQLPERYFAHPVTQMARPIADVPLVWARTREDNASVPRLKAPVPLRIHPADYFSWPTIKTPRTDRILPREHDTVLGPNVGDNLTVRRFGPVRADLQPDAHSADVLPRTRA